MAQETGHSRLQLLPQTKGFFWEARTRILAWYALLMVCLVVLSIPVFTQLVIREVDERVREDLAEELESFEQFAEEQTTKDLIPTYDNIAAIFDTFLRYKIPGDKTFLIATIKGQFYRASPTALPQVLQPNSRLFKRLALIERSIRGQNIVSDPQVGDLIYKTEPLVIQGQIAGVLIIASSTDGERQEVLAAVGTVIQVLIFSLFIALLLAWLVAGQVLQPIRTLSKTARSIGESDLTKRIPIHGNGEMADLAKTFNRMMDRLQQAFQTQRNFINDAGHELRTPITIMRGHLELLELEDDPQERQATIDLVLDELDRMTRFVEDLVLLAKTEQTNFLHLETIALENFTEELYLKAQCLSNRNWKLEGKGEGIIMGDRQRLTQAIMNLAENATQHTTEKDTIALGTSIRERYVKFWVRDTGTGIKLKDQERIFQRFARASDSLRRSQGAGLGLAIVQAIAQSHDGRIELYSLPGIGSTFTLILPLKPS